MEFVEGSLVFEFSGKAQERESSNSNEKALGRDYDLAELMNQRSSEMAERIRKEVKRMLPPGIEITVEIDYFAGSIEWAGVITVLDWAARIADNISLIEYIKRAIQFAMNRTHRLELRRFPPSGPGAWQVETEVRVVRFPESYGKSRGSFYGLPHASPGFGDMRNVMYLNTILLLVIVVMLLWDIVGSRGTGI